MFLLIRTQILMDIANQTKFTFHNVSINSGKSTTLLFEEEYLHSTMFLLIRKLPLLSDSSVALFTFHNVSINSFSENDNTVSDTEFTFHNVSINSIMNRSDNPSVKHLHSTMFLLIPLGSLQQHADGTIYIPQCFY